MKKKKKEKSIKKYKIYKNNFKKQIIYITIICILKKNTIVYK